MLLCLVSKIPIPVLFKSIHLNKTCDKENASKTLTCQHKDYLIGSEKIALGSFIKITALIVYDTRCQAGAEGGFPGQVAGCQITRKRCMVYGNSKGTPLSCWFSKFCSVDIGFVP